MLRSRKSAFHRVAEKVCKSDRKVPFDVYNNVVNRMVQKRDVWFMRI
jgi:hypothetical protein